MADPKLKRASVTITYTASDGYRSQVCYSNIGRMGVKPPPEAPLLEAVEELSRLCALFGHDAEAAKRFNEARERVAAFFRERDQRAAQTGGAA